MSLNIALVGKANVGKSTLFNRLTKQTASIGNWSGVTHDKKTAYLSDSANRISLVDLPGIDSLFLCKNSRSFDYKVAIETCLSDSINILINVIDAQQFEQGLLLTTELLRLGIPMITVINMYDLALAQGKNIDVNMLSDLLGCSVFATNAKKGKGINELKTFLLTEKIVNKNQLIIQYPSEQETKIEKIKIFINKHTISLPEVVSNYEAEFYIINQSFSQLKYLNQTLLLENKNINENNFNDELLIMDEKYERAKNIIDLTVSKVATRRNYLTDKLDSFLLNRFLGLPIFLLVMYIMFFLTMNIGGVFQNFIELVGNALLVDGVSKILAAIHIPHSIIMFISGGICRGLVITLTFIPVLAVLYGCMSFLENSGYLARAGFLVDRIMKVLGLPGKAFVPLIVGFGCNVPAVMSTRILNSKRERIVTAMMSPFMSCSARLAIYSIFVSVFFGIGGQNIIFMLYLLGVSIAVLTGFILQYVLSDNKPTPLIVDLPSYKMPSPKMILQETKLKLKSFTLRAGKMIILLSSLLGLFGFSDISSSISTTNNQIMHISDHFLSIFSLMGIDADNWQAIAGLFAGIMAKEVLIGTLSILYSSFDVISNVNMIHQLQFACTNLFSEIQLVMKSILHPQLVLVNTSISKQFSHQLSQHFSSIKSVIAYLIFISLYIPCVATLSAIANELNWRWGLLSAFWSIFIAYFSAVAYYQFQWNMILILKYCATFIVIMLSWMILKLMYKNFCTRKTIRADL